MDGTYDQAFDLTIQASEEFGWYCRNTGYNPFTAEGKKTAAYEIWEQVLLNYKGKKPLTVFVSVGDGNIISGIHKGFKDLAEIGWQDQMPRLCGVQAIGSAAVANAYFAELKRSYRYRPTRLRIASRLICQEMDFVLSGRRHRPQGRTSQ